MREPRTRREFLRCAVPAAAGALGLSVGAQAQSGAGNRLAPYVADASGDGFVSHVDEQLVRAALSTRRGFGITPNPRWDFRADVLGRGAVDSATLDAVAATVAGTGPVDPVLQRRPLTVCWHYGWYDTLLRPPGFQTVRFLGGDYVSRDPEIEATFNDLKNEAGVSVDALSWMPRRVRPSIERNYRQGYFQAHNSATRIGALLYESVISLGSDQGRIDFGAHRTRALLNEDFEQMGQFFVELRDRTPVRPFLLAGRPVVFLFGSHIWETGNAGQVSLMTEAIADARSAFKQVYGVDPYLVGDELWNLSRSQAFTWLPEQRLTHFDAVFAYHHALMKPGVGTIRMDPFYRQTEGQFLEQAYRRLGLLRNLYTGHQILAIPSLAPGFAKPGWPTLTASRDQFVQFIRSQKALHLGQYVSRAWLSALGTADLPAPVLTIGSWNEEFEGHAVFPSRFNRALPAVRQRGFDLSMALREVFGWNHYARRDP